MHSKVKHIGIFLVIVTVLSSCSQSKNDTETQAIGKDWQLIKVDSIQIPFLGTPQLHDVDPKNQRLVFMQSGPSEEEVFVANFDGELLHSFEAHGNTLVGFLRLMAPLKFDRDGSSLLAFGVPHVKNISLDGEKLEVLYSGNTPYYSTNSSPRNELIDKGGRIFYNNLMNDQEFKPDRADFYNKLRLVGFLDLEKKEKNNFLEFPDESVYASGKTFPHSAWVSHFTFSKDHLNVVFEGEPALFVFEGQSPFTYIKKIELNLKEFQFYQGVPEGERVVDFMENMITMGKMSSIKTYDNKILVFYSPGFNSKQLKTWATASSPEERNEMINRFRKETPPRVHVVDEEYNFLADSSIPSHIHPTSIFERDGFLWAAKSNPDEEEDFFTIYKLILDQVETQVSENN